jgi:hypothetical protein
MLNYQLNFHASSQYSFEPRVNYFTSYQEEDNYILDVEGLQKILYGTFDNWFKPFMINNVKYSDVNQTNCYAHFGLYNNTIRNSRNSDIMTQTVLYMCMHIKTGKIIIATFTQIQYFPHLFVYYLIQRINSFPKKIQHLRMINKEMKVTGNNLGQVITDSIVCKIAFFNRAKQPVLKYLNNLATSNQDLDFLFNCFPDYNYDDCEQVQILIEHECLRRGLQIETINTLHELVACDLFNIGRDGFAGDIFCWYVNRMNNIKLTNNLNVSKNHISVFYDSKQLDAVFSWLNRLQVFLQDSLLFEQVYPEAKLVNLLLSFHNARI